MFNKISQKQNILILCLVAKHRIILSNKITIHFYVSHLHEKTQWKCVKEMCQQRSQFLSTEASTVSYQLLNQSHFSLNNYSLELIHFCWIISEAVLSFAFLHIVFLFWIFPFEPVSLQPTHNHKQTHKHTSVSVTAAHKLLVGNCYVVGTISHRGAIEHSLIVSFIFGPSGTEQSARFKNIII